MFVMNKPSATTVGSFVKVIIKLIHIIRDLFSLKDNFQSFLVSWKIAFLMPLFVLKKRLFHHLDNILGLLFQSYWDSPNKISTYLYNIWKNGAGAFIQDVHLYVSFAYLTFFSYFTIFAIHKCFWMHQHLLVKCRVLFNFMDICNLLSILLLMIRLFWIKYLWTIL